MLFICLYETGSFFQTQSLFVFVLLEHVPSLNFLFFLSPACEFSRIHLKFWLTFQIPYLASNFLSLYSTCLVVLVVYVPYRILVGTLRHLIEFTLVVHVPLKTKKLNTHPTMTTTTTMK